MRKFIAVMAALALLITVPAFAQREVAQITGTVTDASGAVVSGATVTVTSVERQTTRTTVTTSSGSYAVTHLLPGKYKVTISHAGFSQISSMVDLMVGQTLGYDAQLKVGAMAETIEVVAGGAAAVNTETQTIQQVVTSQQLSEMPSLSRDAYSLVATAGMVTPDPSGRGTGYAINGLRSASTNVTLDGAENMDMFTASYSNTVPMDAVHEFSILSNGFTAEFGRASAGMVNVVTKSGTNTFHGSAYEYNRNSAITSNSYQNAATLWDAVNRGTCTGFDDRKCPGRKGVFARNQFGFSIGGPVIKNKLFFFTNTEWLRVRSSGPRQRWVLAPSFIATLPANVQQFMAIGKLKSNLINTDVMTASRLQTLIGSTGAFATWAAANPNAAVFQGVNWTVPQNLGGGTPQNTMYDVSRVDYNISDRTSFYGRYSLDKENFFPTSGLSPYQGYDVATSFYSQNWLASLSHAFSNTITSQTKVAFNRENNQQPLAQNPAGPTLYLNPSTVPSFDGKRLDFPGYLPEGPGTAIPFGGPQNVYQFNQDLTWTKGKHTFRFGGQYTHLRDNHTFGAYMNAVEDLSSGSSATAFNNLLGGVLNDFQAAIDPQGKFPCPKTVDPNTGLVTTQVSSACQVNLPVGFPRFSRNNRYNDGAIYAQDAWKLTPRFTLNLGLRWEYYGVQHNADPKLDSNLYLGTGGNYSQNLRSATVQLTGNSPDGGLWKPYYRGFGPRVGFAWDIFGNGKTSLRGGYGISYERNFGNVTYNVIQNPPNYAVIGLTAADVGSPIQVTTNNAGPLTGTGTKTLPAVTLRNPKQNIKPAYAEIWNLSIDRELAPETTVSISYAGSHGIHQYSITNINRTGFGQFLLGDPLPWYNPTTRTCVAAFATGYRRDINYCGTRANLQYSSANMRGDDGFSNYHALNIGVRSNNFRKSGVMLTANYTWSHAIDNISNTFAEGTNSMNLGLLDPFMPALDRGNSEFDVRHRLTTSAIWTMPFFKHSNNRILKHALGGWELIPSFVIRSGEPFSIFDCTNGFTVCPRYMPVTGPVAGGGSSDPASMYNGTTGANVNRFAYLNLPVTSANKVQGIGAYGNPALGTYVTGVGWSDFPTCTGLNHTGCTWPSNMTQRDAFRGPMNWNNDLGIYKNFDVSERIKLQVRGEMYDVFNHKNFYLDTGTFDAASNPVIKVRKDDYRNVQLGARITF